MTYNLNIFKSPSYQKIFKEVLKLRHPNLNEEEALKEEAKITGCLLLISGKNEEDIIGTFDLYDVLNTFFEPRNTIKHRILGRPITTSELVDVLNLLDKGDDFYYQVSAIYQKDVFQGITQVHFRPKIAVSLKQNTYYLDEQSQETIDKIADLITKLKDN